MLGDFAGKKLWRMKPEVSHRRMLGDCRQTCLVLSRGMLQPSTKSLDSFVCRMLGDCKAKRHSEPSEA